MASSRHKAIKKKSFEKIYENAPLVPCACGCGEEIKSKDHYGRNRKYISGHNGRKYKDPKQYKREWNHRNRDKRYQAKKRRHRMLKVKLLKKFGEKCVDCGVEYDKNAAIFHFHHKDPRTKEFALGNRLTALSWAKILKEAEKCDLLCAFCHELRHTMLLDQKSTSDRCKKRRARSKEKKCKLVSYFNNKCHDCGRKFTKELSRCFHFHHIDPTKKGFTISKYMESFSVEKLLIEAKKCVLICVNCHELRHGEIF